MKTTMNFPPVSPCHTFDTLKACKATPPLSRTLLGVLAALCLLSCFQTVSAATRITATIAITNTPNSTTQSLTFGSLGVRTWTNNITVPASQIATTNNIQNSRTNLKVQLDGNLPKSYWVIQYGSGTNDVKVLFGTNEYYSTLVTGLWATVTLVTNTVYISDYVLMPPNGMQSNTFLQWQMSAIATNLAKSTNGLPVGVLTTNLIDTSSANQSGTNKSFFGGTNNPASFLATNGGVRNVWSSNMIATNLTGTATNLYTLASTNENGTFTNVVRENVNLLVVTNVTVFGGTSTNIVHTGSTYSGTVGTLTGGSSTNQFGTNWPSLHATNVTVTGKLSATNAFLDRPTVTNESGSYISPTVYTGAGSGLNRMLITNLPAGDTPNLRFDQADQTEGIEIDFCWAGISPYFAISATSNSFGIYSHSDALFQVQAGTITIGTTTIPATIAGNLQVLGTITNNIFRGTNYFKDFWSFKIGTYSGMSSSGTGLNSVQPATNVYTLLSGNAADCSIYSIKDEWSERDLTLINASAFNMTLINESGSETTVGRRLSIPGSVNAVISPGGAAHFIHDESANRWRFDSPGSTTTATNLSAASGSLATNTANFSYITNPIVTGQFWTNTTGARVFLKLNYTLGDSVVSGFPGLAMTNVSSGEWFNATNSLVVASSVAGRADFNLSPGDYFVATNKSSGSATVTIDGSFAVKQ